jgi:CheY-like chemotaxis protein
MYEKRKINKILIVDDSEMNRAILADMLREKYEILEAEDGVAAIEKRLPQSHWL